MYYRVDIFLSLNYYSELFSTKMRKYVDLFQLTTFVSLHAVWSNPRYFESSHLGKVWESYMAENLVSLFHLSTKGNSKNKADVRAEDNHTEANKN